MKDPKMVKQGKRNRINGANFEKKVRASLEKDGWFVSKWQNNLEHADTGSMFEWEGGLKMTAAKGNRFFMRTTGFPDFIAYSHIHDHIYKIPDALDEIQAQYKVIGVEAKSNGYLDKVEKAKCQWYLVNKVFSKILIASKGKKRGEIIYEEFK